MKTKQGKIALFQVSLLMISLFAFAFLVGGMGRVGAKNDIDKTNTCTVANLQFMDEYKDVSGFCTSQTDCESKKGASFDNEEGGLCGNNICCYIPNTVKEPDEEDESIIDQAAKIAQLESQVSGLLDKLNSKQDSVTPNLANNPSDEAKWSLGKMVDITGAKDLESKGYYDENDSRSSFWDLEKEERQLSRDEAGEYDYSNGVSFALSKLGNAAVWAGVAYGLSYVGGLIWEDEAERWSAAGTAAALGIGTYSASTAFLTNVGVSASAVAADAAAAAAATALAEATVAGTVTPALTTAASTTAATAAASFSWVPIIGAVAAATAIIISLSTFEEENYEYVVYTCHPWAAQTGGEHCEECNEQGDISCTEYQCKSLGQACELINKDETGEPLCYWKNPKDVTPPVMEPLSSALLTDFDYTPEGAISPPDRGVIIEYKDGKLPPFTPVAFGISTDEPSRCKIDISRKEDFDSMMGYFGDDASFALEHTQTIILSQPDTTSEMYIKNGGKTTLYVRCQDPNGNYDLANFVFTYEVEEGPDTTPPLIITTSILNGFPIAYNQSSTDLIVYTNEPADCKWDHLDKDYEEMDAEMVCTDQVSDFNAQMLYECETTLEGLISDKENKFYFRCKDQPNLEKDSPDRNVNTESYIFTLLGTLPLQIDSVKPDDTIIEGPSTKVKVTLEVETSAGYNEGISTCKYKDQGETAYIDFYDTYSYHHTQDLWLDEDDYNYSIMCKDLGGNVDYANAVFSVETDLESPIIVRAYYEDGYMKLITSEEAMCIYSIDSTTECNYAFEDGIELQSYESIDHFVEWNTEENLYIKCKDAYDIQPTPQNTCSIIVRASEYYEAEE